MKKNTILSFFIFIVFNLCAQVVEKKVDFILVVNENVVEGGVSGLQIKVEYRDSVCLFPVTYYPGSLIIQNSDYDLLFSKEVKSLSLLFDYSEYDSYKNWKMYNYEIDLNPKWLKNMYCIMYVYHLSFSKYKKMFNPLSKGRNYTFELDSPGYTFRRVRK